MRDELNKLAERYGAWLHSHDTGLSSEAIFHYMTLGVRGGSAPHDPADLGRCLRLLAAFPEWKDRMPEMVKVSPEWAAMVPHWQEIEALFLEEAGGELPSQWARWSAPRTYARMVEIRA